MAAVQNDSQDLVYSKNVIEMLTVANEFCLFLEKAEEYPLDQILSFLQKICPLIYLKASLLPEIKEVQDESAEHFVTEETWEGILNSLQVKFGDDDVYHYIDLHEKSNLDAVPSTLSETFADIYQDLKDFVLLYQKPQKASMEYAVSDCKRLFETRFGFRLVNAQMALHYLLYRESTDMRSDGMADLWDE